MIDAKSPPLGISPESARDQRVTRRAWQFLPSVLRPQLAGSATVQHRGRYGTQHCYFAGSAGIVRVLCAPFVVWMRYPSCPESQTSASTYTVKYSV